MYRDDFRGAYALKENTSRVTQGITPVTNDITECETLICLPTETIPTANVMMNSYSAEPLTSTIVIENIESSEDDEDFVSCGEEEVTNLFAGTGARPKMKPEAAAGVNTSPLDKPLGVNAASPQDTASENITPPPDSSLGYWQTWLPGCSHQKS